MRNTGDLSDAERAQIKELFIAERGYWRPWTETMLQACPGFVQQYARYAGYPSRTGPLTERMVELIYVGLDASASHLFEAGLHTHMKRALEVGATHEDIFDVLHLVAVQGAASTCQAADMLAELAGADSAAAVDEKLQARIDRLGSSHALALDAMARLDPGYAEALLDFVEHGRPLEGLTPGERSLVQLAMHACFTAANPQATRQVISTALAQGRSPAELLQAIQLGAHLAVHGAALGATVFGKIAASSIPTPDEPPGPS
jgi:alkylhydroperoxidase/carboxymuconolactone decarboxylase family protein YurZ